ncbi:hypothetical protein AUP44_21445 [Tistrella mobilis]|uniref:Uncharacterized protein n=1 Tax=Tistrella mobilis TaxID=171437 RepID=A0A162LTU8_9PROT|nr:hypothetical protein AUP44_21445 [Tistrella mobilis]
MPGAAGRARPLRLGHAILSDGRRFAPSPFFPECDGRQHSDPFRMAVIVCLQGLWRHAGCAMGMFSRLAIDFGH